MKPYTHRPSGEAYPDVVFMGGRITVETRPGNSAMRENMEKWPLVLQTDESKFKKVFGKYLDKDLKSRTIRSLKTAMKTGGGSLNVWGHLSVHGVWS